ncbi:lytic polysaccharide monooxygenase [Streptomyces sp. NPDC090022]|uniref:lytic polysaccharide monooxygenase auxiliary activity family 9 protein n=1 Tax=Streptomyces sp. NPDC090022 TaxID=3365920 RepID=UPI0038249826
MRNGTARAVVGPAALIVLGLTAGPAAAHGAAWTPVSRSVACTPDSGRYLGSPACDAALAASPGGALADWDNVRLKDVDGRDRDRVPDGKVCSAGLARFRGLDLPRDDWPVTQLTAGAPFTFRYRSSIPHAGRFELYVTRSGYDPGQPLKWSDLEPQPFLTVTDPPLVENTYTFTGQLPTGRTGRHLILTVWRNTRLPDTYYSCADVHFPADPGTAPAPPAGEGAQPARAAQAAAEAGAGAGAPISLASAARTPGRGTNGAAVAGASLAIVSLTSFLLLVFWVRRVKRC